MSQSQWENVQTVLFVTKICIYSSFTLCTYDVGFNSTKSNQFLLISGTEDFNVISRSFKSDQATSYCRACRNWSKTSLVTPPENRFAYSISNGRYCWSLRTKCHILDGYGKIKALLKFFKLITLYLQKCCSTNKMVQRKNLLLINCNIIILYIQHNFLNTVSVFWFLTCKILIRQKAEQVDH